MSTYALVAQRVRPSPIHFYVAGLGIVAGSLIAGLLQSGASIREIWVVCVLAVTAAIADRGTVRLSKTVEISVVTLPVVFAAVVLGPLAAALVAAASMLLDLVPREGTDRPYLKWVTYTLSRAITGCLVGLAAAIPLESIENVIPAILAATAIATSLLVVLDFTFVTLTLRLRGVGTLADAARTLGPVILSSVPLQTPVLALLAYAYIEISPWTLPLFFGPALAAHKFFVLYHDQRELAESLIAANERLERAGLSFATALVTTLDARDRYTAGHSAAVAIYARDIAARMDLSEEDQELAHLCGLVHDIGKIGLAPGLLEKVGAISLEERRQMEAHSAIGERILSKVEDYQEIASIVRHHHERWDGLGYPDRLAGEAVPLLSRIIAVADSYNAMTSDRPYRDAMPSRVARLRLAQAADSQFDTAVVAAFEAVLAGADETYRLAKRNDFRFEVQGVSSLAASG